MWNYIREFTSISARFNGVIHIEICLNLPLNPTGPLKMPPVKVSEK